MIKELIIFLALIAIAQSIVCTENFCKNAKCTKVHCKSNEVKKKGGLCNCCNVCYTEIGEGGDCAPPPYRGVPSNKECAKGLKCTNNVCINDEPVAIEPVDDTSSEEC